MQLVGAAGLNSFLQGLDNQTYVYNNNWITAELAGSVYLSSEAIYYCNYYGIYPSYYQTASRALPSSITSTYNLMFPITSLTLQAATSPEQSTHMHLQARSWL
jgi:hypothetical protein